MRQRIVLTAALGAAAAGAALIEQHRMIRELLKTEGTGGTLLNATIEVTDDEGDIVLEFPFSEAILDTPDRSVTRH